MSPDLPTEWHCLTCGHPLQEGEECPLPQCVENRARARRAMRVDFPEPHPDPPRITEAMLRRGANALYHHRYPNVRSDVCGLTHPIHRKFWIQAAVVLRAALIEEGPG